MILNTTMHLGTPIVNISEDIRDINDPDETVATVDFSILGDKRMSLQLSLLDVENLGEQLRQVAQAIRQGTDDIADMKRGV